MGGGVDLTRETSVLSGKDLKQGAHFLLNQKGVIGADGVSDFGHDEFAIVLACSMEGGAKGGRGEAGGGSGGIHVGFIGFIIEGEEGAEGFEALCLTLFGEELFEVVESALDEVLGPLAVVDDIGRKVQRLDFELVLTLRIGQVERDVNGCSAAF
jgi:hypothetical protein